MLAPDLAPDPAPAVRSPDRGVRAPEEPAPVSGPVSGAGWLAVGAVVSKAAQTAVLLVFAAVLEPDAFGVISLGAVVLNVTTVVAGLGTSTALVHFRGDAERAARTAVTVALATSMALVALVWLATPWLSTLLSVGEAGAEVFRGVVLAVPLASVAGVSCELLRRALDFRRRVLPDIAGNLVGAVVTVAALASGEGAFSLVYGTVAQALVSLLLVWRLRPLVRLGWSRRDAATLLSYGVSLAGSGLLALLVLNVDYLLIANRLGVHDVGVYSMAFRIAYLPYLLIAMVIGGAVFAHLCRMRGDALWRSVVDAAVVLHAVVVPAYVAVLVLAPQLQLLGEQWSAAVPALRWLAGYGLVLSALELLLVALRSVGRTSDVLGLGALHVGVLLVLLVRYVDSGVTAVAAAQLAAGLVTLVAAVLVVGRRVPPALWARLVRTLARRLAPVAAAAVVMAASALALLRLPVLPPVSMVTLAVVGVAATVAYAATLLFLDRSLVPADRATFDWARTDWAGRAAVTAAAIAAGLGGATAAVLAPRATLVAVVAAAAVAIAVARIEWAALALVAVEPFGDLLREVHPGAVKAVGALLFFSWLVRLAHQPRVALRHPGVYAVGALALTVLGSFVARGADPRAGLDHAVSYASYALVVVVLVDTVRRARPDPVTFATRLALVFAASGTAAAAVGLLGFLGRGGRASGPLADPNDLAFFLVAALALLLVARRRLPVLVLAAAGGVLVVGTLATFSRGAVIALVVMAAVAVVLGALRATVALAVAAVAVAAVGALWLTHADVVTRSLAEKEHVAAANVDLRLTTVSMAAAMTTDRPLLGQGPGGFAAARGEFVPAGVVSVDQTVAHQMYLDVSAELGIVGLVAFLAVLGYGVRGAARARRRPQLRWLGDAVLVGFAGTLVAACFLSEQFYLPVWLLAALGIALDPARPRAEAG